MMPKHSPRELQMPRKPHLRGRGPFFPVLDQIQQYDFEPGYVVFTLPAPKRIRVMAGGHTVADSTRALMLFESDHIPIYYFPLEDIRMDLFTPGNLTHHSPYKGDAKHYSLEDADGAYDDIMWHYDKPVPGCPDISRHASFYWHEVDQWFEEDEEVFVHMRDPFRRIDCLPTTRRVTVAHQGKTLADTTDAILLFETGLPTRPYVPIGDVDMRYLEPSDLRTMCPYKGEAQYYHIRLGATVLENAVWYYPDPVHESARIRGMLSFGREFVDDIQVGNEPLARPITALTEGYNYHGYKER